MTEHNARDPERFHDAPSGGRMPPTKTAEAIESPKRALIREAPGCPLVAIFRLTELGASKQVTLSQSQGIGGSVARAGVMTGALDAEH